MSALESLNWVFLSNLRNSFFAKATSVFAFSSLVLSNSEQILALFEFQPWELFLLFLGSIIFIIGYVLFWVLAPHEFRVSGEIHDHVQRMKNIEDIEFFKSRILMAKNMQNRIQGFKKLKVPRAIHVNLNTQLTNADKNTPPDLASSAGLYRADLQARSFDFPVKRMFTALLLLVGGVMLISTTMMNAVEVIFGLFN